MIAPGSSKAVRPAVCISIRPLVLAFLVVIGISATVLAQTPAQKPAQLPAAAVPVPTPPATIDIQASRLQATRISTNWKFRSGDDPRWAGPAFDDASWKVINPAADWHEQGLATVNNMAWLRFRLILPANMPSLMLLMPGTFRAYQIFDDGQLAAQVGKLPPDDPQVWTSTSRIFILPLNRAKTLPNSNSKEVLVAVRTWVDPRLAGILPNVLFTGTAYAGSPGAVQAIFSLLKSNSLLSRGNTYTQAVITLIVGASSLLLLCLTRRGFYAWFSLNMLAATLVLPVRLLSAHFGWEYFTTVYAYAATDFFSAVTYALFILAALNLLRWRWIALLALATAIAELGPILFILGTISETWADGIYFFAGTLGTTALGVLLIRGWRAHVTYARLLLFPYALSFVINCSGNLGHFLNDLNVPHASVLITAHIQVLSAPFAVTLEDVSNTLATLGLLAVLVYQFAQSSREEQRLKSALQTAHDIQHSLVPVDLPRFGGLHTEIVYLAAEEVGGDFCQILPRADQSMLIVIGDVSGKGLQAAMVGTLAVGALRSMADEDIGPAETLQRLNNVLLRTPNRGFITCLCMILTSSGRVTIANAGHLSPYLDGEEMTTEPGLPLGIVPDIAYEQMSFTLPASARLTLISDGVVEAQSATGELYGFERTSGISHLPANDIAAEARRFGQIDDITVITLDWALQVSAIA